MSYDILKDRNRRAAKQWLPKTHECAVPGCGKRIRLDEHYVVGSGFPGSRACGLTFKSAVRLHDGRDDSTGTVDSTH